MTTATAETVGTGGPRVKRGPSYSPSKIVSAAECGAAYNFRYNLKLETPPKTNLQMGIWLDEVLNRAWTYKLAKGVEIPFSELEAFARAFWVEKVTAIVEPWDLETEPDVILERGIGGLWKYQESYGRTLVPKTVQPWLEVPPGVVGTLRVIGRADLITADDVIVDHKFKGRGFFPQKETTATEEALTELRRDMKMHLYAAGFYAQFKRPPKAIVLIAVVWTANPYVQAVEVPVTASTIRWTMAAAKGAVKTIEGGEYYPNPAARWCSGCEYGKACEEMYGRKQTRPTAKTEAKDEHATG